MNQDDRRRIKGCLEVRAIKVSRIGCSEHFVDEGSIGYVIAHRPKDNNYLICWPNASRADLKVGSHSQGDVEPTGKRG